ncbi:hypothetical protein BKA58DRAFT_230410 [Alternaria rosae]|uniref:uncharacterized protein n=1 Tax=Alternaria rosae TaxID=1187941 RepID=UPI001E8ED4D5|nr:uncharacterized protein BKA58DRAFT_230410 [Alternaria rosae]KAH6865957.1 hypothetical protein BKA58DRAFT_230410 [Alternaria rosae]
MSHYYACPAVGLGGRVQMRQREVTSHTSGPCHRIDFLTSQELPRLGLGPLLLQERCGTSYTDQQTLFLLRFGVVASAVSLTACATRAQRLRIPRLMRRHGSLSAHRDDCLLSLKSCVRSANDDQQRSRSCRMMRQHRRSTRKRKEEHGLLEHVAPVVRNHADHIQSFLGVACPDLGVYALSNSPIPLGALARPTVAA